MSRKVKHNNSVYCDFCHGNSYTVHNLMKIFVKTNKNSYELGMQVVIEKMNTWILKKMYHLSPTEIMLLRPDLFVEFLEYWKPDDIIKSWFFVDYKMCLKCYGDYKIQVPER